MNEDDKFTRAKRGPLGKLYEFFRIKILNIYEKYL